MKEKTYDLGQLGSCERIRFKVSEVSKDTPRKNGVASYTKMRGFWKLALLGAYVLRSVM